MILFDILLDIVMFFSALMPGECQAYVDDSGRIMTACLSARDAPACGVDFYAGAQLDDAHLDGTALIEQGATVHEDWVAPSMHCKTLHGAPMLEMWSSRKPPVSWVFLPLAIREVVQE